MDKGNLFRKYFICLFFPFNHSGALFSSFLVLFYFVQLTFRFDDQAQRAYVFRVGNFQFIMVSQILTKEQLEKISNENLLASFLALQGNILLQKMICYNRTESCRKGCWK